MFQFNILIYILPCFVLSNGESSRNTLIFNIDEIICNNIEHEYNQYYTPPCTKFFHKMIKERQNIIDCVVSFDSNNNEYIGCSHSFGTIDDDISVTYEVEVNKLCSSNLEEICANKNYKIYAYAKLNDPIHPLMNILNVLFIISLLILIFRSTENKKDLLLWFIILFSNSKNRNKGFSSRSWSKFR